VDILPYRDDRLTDPLLRDGPSARSSVTRWAWRAELARSWRCGLATHPRYPGGVEGIAQGETELVIGSAVKHPHPLVCGNYSVHTSREALMRGEAGIESACKRVE
jgi:hypothetical protein